ncbi:hypothetical protein AsAng_0013170 [Aureispira anguillae]|uniref:Uncharacterized protein n=1 Tax=Aureispira anguillae TaxID=2864201 RepID=A0A915YCM3_9BACT|nr:hypothetical protein AsAng_0013170 [Aureispira anguillae]
MLFFASVYNYLNYTIFYKKLTSSTQKNVDSRKAEIKLYH